MQKRRVFNVAQNGSHAHSGANVASYGASPQRVCAVGGVLHNQVVLYRQVDRVITETLDVPPAEDHTARLEDVCQATPCFSRGARLRILRVLRNQSVAFWP